MKVGSHVRDERAARQAASRAKKAESLLANPLIKEAFDNVERKVEEGWKGTTDAPSTPETRERAYLMHRLLVQLKTEFDVIIRNGNSAAKLFEQQESERGRRSKPDPKHSD